MHLFWLWNAVALDWCKGWSSLVLLCARKWFQDSVLVPSDSLGVLLNASFSSFYRRPSFKGEDRPVASVRPVQSTPIPMMPRHVPLGSMGSASVSNPGINFPINYLQRAGVLVQKIVTTTGQMLVWIQNGCMSFWNASELQWKTSQVLVRSRITQIYLQSASTEPPNSQACLLEKEKWCIEKMRFTIDRRSTAMP